MESRIEMKLNRRTILVLLPVIAGVAAPPVSAATRPVTQTLVFDGAAKNRFVDRPPAGPSPGDTEYATGRLRDRTGRIVGTVGSICVFTKTIPNDVLERCTASGTTNDGTMSFAGVGHLESMNPPWQVTGGSGAYKRARGKLVFQADIALDSNVPVATGRLFNISVITVTTIHRLHVGVVPRPAANTAFIRRANAACDATERKARPLPAYPFSSFDPFHPDPKLLPQVGRFFDQPAQRRLPRALLSKLEKIGQPPASSTAWRQVLKARRTAIANDTAQIKAALADDPSAFLRAFRKAGRDYNTLVFASAIFGVQSCTFS